MPGPQCHYGHFHKEFSSERKRRSEKGRVTRYPPEGQRKGSRLGRCYGALSRDLVQRTVAQTSGYVGRNPRIHCRERSKAEGEGITRVASTAYEAAARTPNDYFMKPEVGMIASSATTMRSPKRACIRRSRVQGRGGQVGRVRGVSVAQAARDLDVRSQPLDSAEVQGGLATRGRLLISPSPSSPVLRQLG